MSWNGPDPFASSSNPTSSSSTSRGGFRTSSSDWVPRGGFQGERGRGRGRGAGRGGAGRGAGGPGVKRHTNLSWRRQPDDDAGAQDGQDGEDETGDGGITAHPSSAFAAFGAGGGGFGGFGAAPTSSGAFGTTESSTSAFGSAPSAFGAAGPTFGSAFPSTSTSTAFPSAFSAAPAQPTPGSVPLFRQESQQSEGASASQDEADKGKQRANGQISTLEVLGEDSEARRKRFESTLPNNRYLELKPLREEQRLKAIKAGLIPDPSKPMRLDQATDFEGTCEEMCPEWEREEREYQNNVDPLERYPGTTRIDPTRAVKAFHRPAAGNDQPLPSDVRPPPVLHRTLDYLFHTLLPQHPLAVTHPFIRDRTRSIRQDFTVQNVRGRSAIECNERIARYHILAVGTLREQSGFSESQELEQLRKVLKSLNEFYDDARSSGNPSPSPNEAEFRAYNILTHLRDPDIIWSCELLPPSIFSHTLLQRALAIHRLAQKSNIARGERASQNAFSRFFKLVAAPETPYLFACILSTHFNDVRRNALDALRMAFLQQHSAFPLRTLAKVLGCDDEEDARSVCEQLGVVVRADERGKMVAELHKQAVLKIATLKPKVSMRLVEGKRGETSYQAVIDGGDYSCAHVEAIPATPAVASQSTLAFSAAPPATSVPQSLPPPAPSTLAPPAFGAASSSPLPSPFATPPFGASPVPPPAASTSTGLNATASPFVPSFSLPKAAAPPAPPPATTAAASLPTFSFAPAPPPASSAPAPPAFPSPAEPSTLRPAKRLPPSSLRTAGTAPSFTPSPAPPALPKPVPSPRRPSATSPIAAKGLRRVSLPRAASPATTVAAAALARRQALVDSLVRDLTAELLATAVVAPVQRASASVLKERWAEVKAKEREAKDALAQRLAHQAYDELASLAAREAILDAVRRQRSQRRSLERWRRVTQRSLVHKAEERARRKEWEEVVGTIERTKASRAEDEEGLSDEDDLDEMEDEEEDGGLAGLADAGLDFGSLSLGAARQPDKPRDAVDDDLVTKLRTAAETRERIWSRGTFLDILSQHASAALSSHRLPFRPTWSTLASTTDTESPFGAWLACKFDIRQESGLAEVDTPNVDVEVRLLGERHQPIESELRTTGLLVFDCTKSKGASPDWHAARQRLNHLVGQVLQKSLFKPALLIILCPDRAMSEADESAMKAELAEKLRIDAFVDIRSWEIDLMRLEGAESSFDVETAKLLCPVVVRNERIPRPFSSFLNPLVEVWRASLARACKVVHDSSAARDLTTSYLRQLEDIIARSEAVASPPPRAKLILPEFPTDTSFRSACAAFAALPDFQSSGNFPDLATLLAQQPPASNLSLARVLLEHLAVFVLETLFPMKTLQGSLHDALPSAIEDVKSALATLEERLRPAQPILTPRKKRRASAAPADTNSPKKQIGVNGITGEEKGLLNGRGQMAKPQDRLSALEGLMKDARAFLAR
ncbi:SAC3 family protein 1 [Rhodotorula toruloides]|nr:SAC3 family protein 1 [Rhodotorula toruloides]